MLIIELWKVSAYIVIAVPFMLSSRLLNYNYSVGLTCWRLSRALKRPATHKYFVCFFCVSLHYCHPYIDLLLAATMSKAV